MFLLRAFRHTSWEAGQAYHSHCSFAHPGAQQQIHNASLLYCLLLMSSLAAVVMKTFSDCSCYRDSEGVRLPQTCSMPKGLGHVCPFSQGQMGETLLNETPWFLYKYGTRPRGLMRPSLCYHRWCQLQPFSKGSSVFVLLSPGVSSYARHIVLYES